MTFMEEMVRKNIPIWDTCAETPFVKELQAGVLPEEKFRRYMIQDSIYLKNYARVFGKAIYQSTNLKDIQVYYSILGFVTEEESAVRLSWLKRFGMSDDDIEDMEQAARKICGMGSEAAVVKGGHAAGNALDVLFDKDGIYHFETARIHTKNTHGTGCTFSSAIASELAKGRSMREAVERAKNYVTTAIKHSLSIGKGNGPTDHFYDLYRNGLRG